MASGSSSRANNPGSKGFDFASDDILCSYDDFANQDNTNGNHSDPLISSNSAKEFHKNRMTRTSMFPAPTYSPPEESSVHQDVGAIVEKTVKKYSDNLMRFLEGISSRLSQLELYCYNLDKSIGEMHADLVRDHGEADTKLKSLEKNLQEVHRSVQILRDKQELVEAQKELAKLAHKDSSGSNSQENEDRIKQPASDTKRSDNVVHEQQLALALPHQASQQQQQQQQPVQAPPPIPSQAQGITQSPGYYLPQPQMPQAPNQLSQNQYMPSDSQYRTSQAQDFSRLPSQPVQSQLNQTPQAQAVPPYQQQWVPQLPQQLQQPQPQQQQQPQPQPPSMQQQARPSSPAVYPSYLPNQSNATPEMVPSSVSMQVPFSGISQTVASRPEGMPYGYGGHGRPVQPQPQPQAPAQHLRPTFGATGDGYGVSGPHPSLAPGNAYVMYDGEGARTHPTQQPHFSHGGYPPSSFPMQNPQPAANTNVMARPPQMMRNHPYNELIEKLASMGYRGDHVIGAIQRLEESGQPVDFNTILDRLNGHSSGGSQRGW